MMCTLIWHASNSTEYKLEPWPTTKPTPFASCWCPCTASAASARLADFNRRGLPLDVLVCNAGLMSPAARLETQDGLEMQFQVGDPWTGHRISNAAPGRTEEGRGRGMYVRGLTGWLPVLVHIPSCLSDRSLQVVERGAAQNTQRRCVYVSCLSVYAGRRLASLAPLAPLVTFAGQLPVALAAGPRAAGGAA